MTWEEVTAVSTLALAAVTAWLAQSTRRLAREAGSETRANWQPVLVIEPSVSEGGTSFAVLFHDGTLSIGISNVGRGPALTVDASLYWDDWEPERAPSRAHLASRVVAPDARLAALWRDFEPPRDDRSGIHAWAALKGSLIYGDVSYARYETHFVLGFRMDGTVSLLKQTFEANTALRGSARQRATHRLRLWWRRANRARHVLARRLARIRAGPHG